MKMLEEYEQKSTLLLLGGKEKSDDILELKQPTIQTRGTDSQYDGLFN
jgi:hypothetical protein